MTLPARTHSASRVISGALVLVAGLACLAPAAAQEQGQSAEQASSGQPLDLLRSKPARPRAKASAAAQKVEVVAPTPTSAPASTPATVTATNKKQRPPKRTANKTQPPVASPPAPTVTVVEPTVKPSPPPAAASNPAPRPVVVEVPVKPEQTVLARDYCSNFSNAAAEFRFSWQMQQLAELEGQIKQRIAELEARRAELVQWQEKQEEYRRKAEEGIVAIYSRMRPDAASSQLAVMEEAGAAAILAKLNPKTASLLLNEMNAVKAAKLADLMTGSVDASKK